MFHGSAGFLFCPFILFFRSYRFPAPLFYFQFRERVQCPSMIPIRFHSSVPRGETARVTERMTGIFPSAAAMAAVRTARSRPLSGVAAEREGAAAATGCTGAGGALWVLLPPEGGEGGLFLLASPAARYLIP